MNGIGALIKGTPESSLTLFLPGEDITRRQQSANQKQSVTRTPPHWHPDLRLLASRAVRNKCLLFQHPVDGNLL